VNNRRIDTEALEIIDILSVARALGIQVKNKKALCFLHDEKTPSLSFNTRTNKWKCFGCAQHGGVISLVMQYKKWDFIKAGSTAYFV